MIELSRDALEFRFPEVHEDAVLRIDFQRTLRIPDGDREYPLPPGLGRFPLRHVDDFAARVPERWREHGGVMMPMFQSEALWLNYTSPNDYPFAVKIAAGKINALSGEPWRDGLHRNPQDYSVTPGQPWLDGFCVSKGVVRQFVAAPLGMGASVEEQLTGSAEHGGLQILVHPMKGEIWRKEQLERKQQRGGIVFFECSLERTDMGLAAGGRMRQEIYEDDRNLANWDQRIRARCFVHLANSIAWRAITGQLPPAHPPTAVQYAAAGLPWFDHYDAELKALGGAEVFAKLKSAGDFPGLLFENEEVEPARIVRTKHPRPDREVRQF